MRRRRASPVTGTATDHEDLLSNGSIQPIAPANPILSHVSNARNADPPVGEGERQLKARIHENWSRWPRLCCDTISASGRFPTVPGGRIGPFSPHIADFEQIDTSTGALGTVVNKTLDELIPILIAAPADEPTRARCIERLIDSSQDDWVDRLSPLSKQFDSVAVYPALMNRLADDTVGIVRPARTARGNGASNWSGPELTATPIQKVGNREHPGTTASATFQRSHRDNGSVDPGEADRHTAANWRPSEAAGCASLHSTSRTCSTVHGS